MTARIYLAGPIGGMTWAEASGWRDGVTELLKPMLCWSPLRDFDDGRSLRQSHHVADDGRLQNSSDPGLIPFHELFDRDYNDCMNCSAVLFNFLGAKKQSFGTVCELAWAYGRGVPTVVVIDDGNPNANPFGECMYYQKVNNLADGVNFLRSYFGHPLLDLAGGAD